MNEAIRMQLSAFVDGELPDNEKELLLRRLSQDAELRQELGEYLAIGRAMRGELQLTGVDLLRDRVSQAIEVGDDLAEDSTNDRPGDRRIRPLAGFAIAASVALVAIVALQQLNSGAPGDEISNPEATAAEAITQPSVDEYLQQLRQYHDAAGPENNINTVLTSIELDREAVEDQADDSSSESEDESDDQTDNQTENQVDVLSDEPAVE